MPALLPWIIAAVLAVAAIAIFLMAMKRATRIKLLTDKIEVASRQKKDLDGKIKALKDEKQQAEGRLRKIEWDTMPRLREQLQECRMQAAVQMQEVQKAGEATKQEGQNLEQLTEQQQQQIHQLKITVSTHEQMLQQTREQVTALSRQIDETVEREGRFWERQVFNDAPTFEPLVNRITPIISIVNLRSGVGKGTLTAGVGSALAAMGKKILLIDVDPKRSLTQVCVHEAMPALLAKEHRTLQHFFLWPNPDVRFIFNGLVEAEKVPGCHVLVNSESVESPNPPLMEPDLEEADAQLLGSWLANPLDDDVRMFLRTALHNPELRKRYDYVLLSCPPRLSTSCINALAASDFALIPTSLDIPGAEATHNLLRKIGEYQRSGLLTELQILGILANRTPVASTDALQEPLLGFWNSLKETTQGVWGDSLPFLRTAVPEVQTAENGLPPELAQVFSTLAQELHAKVEEKRQELAKVS